jgi:hypothetical protein
MNIHQRLSEDSLSYAYNYASKYRSDNLLNIGVFHYRDFRAIHSGMTGMSMSEFTKSVYIPGF